MSDLELLRLGVLLSSMVARNQIQNVDFRCLQLAQVMTCSCFMDDSSPPSGETHTHVLQSQVSMTQAHGGEQYTSYKHKNRLFEVLWNSQKRLIKQQRKARKHSQFSTTKYWQPILPALPGLQGGFHHEGFSKRALKALDKTLWQSPPQQNLPTSQVTNPTTSLWLCWCSFLCWWCYFDDFHFTHHLQDSIILNTTFYATVTFLDGVWGGGSISHSHHDTHKVLHAQFYYSQLRPATSEQSF